MNLYFLYTVNSKNPSTLHNPTFRPHRARERCPATYCQQTGRQPAAVTHASGTACGVDPEPIPGRQHPAHGALLRCMIQWRSCTGSRTACQSCSPAPPLHSAGAVASHKRLDFLDRYAVKVTRDRVLQAACRDSKFKCFRILVEGLQAIDQTRGE